MRTRSIALWQLVGGVLILAVNVAAIIQSPDRLLGYEYLFSSLAVALLAIVSGTMLWQRKPRGIPLSIVSQVLQLVWVSLPSIQFGSTLGPTIGPRITSSSVFVSFGFYGRAGLSLLPNSARYHFPLDVTVNILACVALIALFRGYERRPLESATAQRAA